MQRKAVIIFVSLGVVHFLISILLAGAGYGWVTGLHFSFASVIFYPLAGYALLRRDKLISMITIIGSVLLTTFLLVVTSREIEYYLRSWRVLPVLMSLYFLLWAGWPLLALMGLIKKN